MKNDIIAFNQYGGFSKDGNEYYIYNKNTPLPWSNVIANETFGSILSSKGIVYTFFKNSREYKISNWSNDWTDIKVGEKFTGIYDKEYNLTYGFGYVKVNQDDGYIEKNMDVFIPEKDNVKVHIISLKNTGKMTKTVNITYEIDPVLGVSKELTQDFLIYKQLEDYTIMKNPYSEEFPNSVVAIASSEKDAIYLDKSVEINIVLKPEEEYTFTVILAAEDGLEKLDEVVKKYKDLENAKAEYINVINYWKSKVKKNFSTGDNYVNIMANGWLLYQTIACRIFARTSFYQAGGAYGYRDQLQDVLALLRTWPERARNQILIHANKQFEKGDVLHWWHQHNGRGIRTYFSDDYLWLPYVTSEYVFITGDKTVLDEKAKYLENKQMGSHRELYDHFANIDVEESVYKHCLRAIKYGLSRKDKKNGLLDIGDGDWNDGFSSIRGQSVWLTFFMMDVLKRFIKIAKIKKDNETANLFETERHALKHSVIANAWDGDYFVRAYFENGAVLGSKTNDECMIDLISQAWGAIALKEYKDCKVEIESSLQSVEKYLVDRDNKLIRLLYPPIDNMVDEPGYIRAYVPGIRENGGQYTHGAIWLAKAYFELNEKEKGLDVLKLLNPIYHGENKKIADKYKVEPFVVTADVYSNSEHKGRGGWSWYTGSSGWMYKVIEDYLTGEDTKKMY
ncbi:MAG: hypothetical protein RR988_01650 [Clostridia bacterium]